MDDTDIITYFEIPGQPRPQPRHRATKHGTLYLPGDAPVRAYKDAIRLAAIAAGLKPHAEAVYITQHFIFARPASHINAATMGGGITTASDCKGDRSKYGRLKVSVGGPAKDITEEQENSST